MEHNPDAEAIRALITEQEHRSKIGRLRAIIDDIEKAMRHGVSQDRIVSALNEQGFALSRQTFQMMLYRIRKERATSAGQGEKPAAPKAVQKPKATPAGVSQKPAATNMAADFVNPLDKIMEDYQKDRANNPRRDDFSYNPVPDPKKLYGEKE